jgi:hypothetical protein
LRTGRRLACLCVGAALALAASGCGGSGPSVSSGSAPIQQQSTVAPDPASATQVVSYQGVQFAVPADWPVYDLAAAPSTCVRFDLHAVYLGHPGADQQCPAAVVGRSDAVLVEPTDGQTTHAPAAGVSTSSVNGLEVQVDAGADVSREIHATIPTFGVAAIITYRDSDTTAQQIWQSFRSSGG